MYWQDTDQEQRYVVPDDVVDVAFAIACRCLPVDHAWPLSTALRAALPWLADERAAGIHTLHVAESGNGWMRPANPDDLLYPSRRSKLTLRLPRARLAEAARLTGQTLDIAGYPLRVEKPTVKPLSDLTTLFARYVVIGDADNEDAFLVSVHGQLAGLGIRPRKMLCGIERTIATPHGGIRTRSLMLADLPVEQSVRLQQEGLGPQRLLGCGLFIPHKGIHEVAAPRQ